MRSVLTRASAALDRGVVRLMERRMTPRAPRRSTPAPSVQSAGHDARQTLIDVARHYSAGTLGSPSPFFPMPELPCVQQSTASDGPLGTRVIDLSFASEYRPYHPEARDRYLAFRENSTAHARWWTSDVGRPTIVMIHGWGADNHWVNARAFDVPYWLRHGYDVAAFVLPFHGARAPDARGVVKSGALFPSSDPLRTNEGFGQAIYDLRALARFVRQHGSSTVGVMGMSLGGYTAALWASVAGPTDPSGVDFAVAMIPAVSFSRLMFRIGKDSLAHRRAANAGITEDLLADAFAVHSPITRAPAVPRERLFVIAGRGDCITPADHAEELAAHWGTEILWFDGGHLAQVGRGDAVRTVRRALGQHDFEGRTFRS